MVGTEFVLDRLEAGDFDDGGEKVAHLTTNVSPGPGVEHDVDFFHAHEIARIEDPETGAVLFVGDDDE